MRKLFLFMRSALNEIEVKNAIKMGMAAAFSFYLGFKLTHWVERPDPLASGLWCVVATIVALQANLGGTCQAIVNRLWGVIIGSLCGALLSHLLGSFELALGVAVCGALLVCSLFGLKESYRIAALSVAAVMIPWGATPSISPWTFAFFRFLDTLLGLIIAAIVAYTIWPSEANKKIQANLVKTLELVERLYRYTLILNYGSSPQEGKALQTLINEINQLFIQNHLMLQEAKLEVGSQALVIPIWEDLMQCLELLFYVVNSLQNVYNEALWRIFDKELKQQIDDLIEKNDLVFKELSLKLNAWRPISAMQEALKSEALLSVQLVRFRRTYRTRKFSLDAVEKYFVFLYQIKFIATELNHFNYLLDSYYASKESTN